MTPQEKARKTIQKSFQVINKQIECLEHKKQQIDERWPESLYGLRAQGRKDAIDAEIEELRNYMNGERHRRELEEQSKIDRRHVLDDAVLFEECARCLNQYMEYTLATRCRNRERSIE